jgi:hypothetical protein
VAVEKSLGVCLELTQITREVHSFDEVSGFLMFWLKYSNI